MKEVKKEEKRNRDERVEKFNQWEGQMSWRQGSRLPTWKGVPGTGHIVIRQFAGVSGVGGQTLGSLLLDNNQRQAMGTCEVGDLGLRSLSRMKKGKM